MRIEIIMKKHKYVLNAIFSRDMDKVLVIKKNRPEWQSGKFNLIGGRVEDTDKSTAHAVIRETKEECGIDISEADIYYSGTLLSSSDEEEHEVECFVTITDEIYNSTTTTDELVYMLSMEELGNLSREILLETLMPIIEMSKLRVKGGTTFKMYIGA